MGARSGLPPRYALRAAFGLCGGTDAVWNTRSSRRRREEELLLWWDHWLREAQAWNDRDEDEYSHGVFALPRSEWPSRAGGGDRPAP